MKYRVTSSDGNEILLDSFEEAIKEFNSIISVLYKDCTIQLWKVFSDKQEICLKCKKVKL